MSGETLTVDIRVRERVEVCFTAPPGFTVLFGPSGAGKTSTLLTVAGLLRPTSGTIRLGSDPRACEILDDAKLHVPPEKRHIGLVFQSLALFPHLTARENVEYGVRGERRARRATADEWLERLHVTHVAARRPATFSGGEGQRVALARALATQPRVLLLDEPFSALDDSLRESLRADLAKLVAEARIPVLFVTHDQREASALASQIVVLAEGRVVRIERVEQVPAER